MAKQTTKTTVNKETNPDIRNLSKIFDCDYFENGIASKKSNYTNYSWERLGLYFQKTAKHIINKLNPESALDVGCAKGFLVKAFSELGVSAKGIDPSEYAIAEASKDIKDMLTSGVAQSIPFEDNSFDVVTCFDVMEHIPEKDINKALRELLRVSGKWLIIRVVTKDLPNDLDASHESIHDKNWWNEKIKKIGGVVKTTETYVNNSVWWFNVPEFLIVVRKG